MSFASGKPSVLLLPAILLAGVGIAAIVIGAINLDADDDDDGGFDDSSSSSLSSSLSSSVSSISSSSFVVPLHADDDDDDGPCTLVRPREVSLALWLLIGGIALVLWAIFVFIRYAADNMFTRFMQGLFFLFLALPWLIIGTELLIQERVPACSGSALLIMSIIFLVFEYIAVVFVLFVAVSGSLYGGGGEGAEPLMQGQARYAARPMQNAGLHYPS